MIDPDVDRAIYDTRDTFFDLNKRNSRAESFCRLERYKRAITTYSEAALTGGLVRREKRGGGISSLPLHSETVYPTTDRFRSSKSTVLKSYPLLT